MSAEDAEGSRAGRWVLIALVAIALLVVAGVVGVPWAIRGELIGNQARTCEIAGTFVRERPGARADGPREVGGCLDAIVQELDPAVRQQLEDGIVEHGGGLRRPSEPLHGSLLDVPLGEEVFGAIERCAGAKTARWRGDDGLAIRALLERFSREAHLERDPDRRVRRLLVALELWVDAYAMLDLSITAPLLWARELGHTGQAAGARTRADAAERMRALAASLPDIETATALFYCAVYGEVRQLELFDAWEANDQFGASLAMAAETDPGPWGRNPPLSRLDRAIPSGKPNEQFAEPGSAYVAGTLIVAAHQLDPGEDTFLGQSVHAIPVDDAPMSVEPCHELVLPGALDDRELAHCAIEPEAQVATRELARLYRAVRATALGKERLVPERIEDLALGARRSGSESEVGGRRSVVGSRSRSRSRSRRRRGPPSLPAPPSRGRRWPSRRGGRWATSHPQPVALPWRSCPRRRCPGTSSCRSSRTGSWSTAAPSHAFACSAPAGAAPATAPCARRASGSMGRPTTPAPHRSSSVRSQSRARSARSRALASSLQRSLESSSSMASAASAP